MKHTAVLAALTAIAAAVVIARPAAAQPASATSVVHLSALSSGLRFNTTTLHAKAGRIKILFANHSALNHNVRIEKGENELGGTKTIGTGSTSAIVTLKKGTYNFYCSVPGHEDAGMHGTLIVS